VTEVELQARITLLRVTLRAALSAIDYACGCLPSGTAQEVRAHVDGSCGSPNAFIVLRQESDSFRALRVLLLRERRRVVRAIGRILGNVVDVKLLLVRVNEEMEKFET